jgi:guanylate kinase
LSDRIAFVLSAPSGAGKTTLASALLSRVGDLTRTVSWTSRELRNGEVDGVDYVFVSRARFEQESRNGGFLEWALVHGNLYGTPSRDVDGIMQRGEDALMVIDVQGADSVREALADAVTIFVLPPSRTVLEARLKDRDAADEAARAQIERRLDVAADEIARYVSYDYVVVNDDFEDAVADLVGIVRAERARRQRRASRAERIRASFEQGAGSPPAAERSNTETSR